MTASQRGPQFPTALRQNFPMALSVAHEIILVDCDKHSLKK